MTNAGKHARTSSVTVLVEEGDGQVVVEIADDGVGGADPARGSGLIGLYDRVAALGGRLEVSSEMGQGMRLCATIPCP